MRTGKPGDLYVEVILEVPTKLNGKQKKSIEEMAKVVDKDCYHEKTGFAQKLKEVFGIKGKEANKE